MEENKLRDIKNRSFNFSLKVIELIDDLPKNNVIFVVRDQLLRSATSVGANVVEAKCASSRKDFANYYQIALKSANETRYWLLLLLHSKRANNKHIDPLLIELDEICRILAKSLLTLKSK